MTEAELFNTKGAEMSGNKLKNHSKAPVFRGFRLSERPRDNDLISGAIGRIIFCASIGLQVWENLPHVSIGKPLLMKPIGSGFCRI